MASSTISFPLERYSSCDVPMSQADAKAQWIHHSARDHLYLVLQHEGPLEQPSDPKFPCMTKLTVKVIWRAMTLESINISDILIQESGYIDHQNIVCMIRAPSMALKFVNLRTQNLHRMQVRFCKQEDFQPAIASLEQFGCPVQQYVVESGQASQQQQQKGSGSPYERPNTATSITGAGNYVHYPRPDTASSAHYSRDNVQTGSGDSIEQRTPLFPQTVGLSATGSESYGPYLRVQTSFSEPPRVLMQRHQNPDRFSVKQNVGSSPPPRPVKQASSILRAADIGTPNPFLGQRRISFQEPSKPYSSPLTSHVFNAQLAAAVAASQLSSPIDGSPFDLTADDNGAIPRPHSPAYILSTASAFGSTVDDNAQRNMAGPISSSLPRAQADTSVPVSRGTLTSAGTIFGQGSQVPEPVVPASQQVDSSPLRVPFLDDEGIPPRRTLPDFDKINKVHGDKPLPSSARKISSTFKVCKDAGSGPNTPALKRKGRCEDDTELLNSSVGSVVVKRPKFNPPPLKRKESVREDTEVLGDETPIRSLTLKRPRFSPPLKPRGDGTGPPDTPTRNVTIKRRGRPALKRKGPCEGGPELEGGSTPAPAKRLKLTPPAPTKKTPAGITPEPVAKPTVRRKATAATKPKKTAAAVAAVATPATPIPSPPKGGVLKETSPSKLNGGPKTPHPANVKIPKASGRRVRRANQGLDGEIDEKLLCQLLNSDKHLEMLEKLEGVWAKTGFKARIRASTLLGGGKADDGKS
ncbi:hypothetical protein TWF730_005280 [Orbilia blumenaviensis]|uniref:Uncharacterized protein n=1 Tax=Orbilia blumenaviensis TaxID=1796055 RepID=A0AAV9VHX9_9PEZI